MQVSLSYSPILSLKWSESQLETMYCVQKPQRVPHQNWRQEAVSIQRSSPGGAPGLLFPSPRLSLQQAQRCLRSSELCKVSYSPVSPCWDTEVTCGMASPRASGRFLGQRYLVKAFPICLGKIACRSYASAWEKPAVAMTILFYLHTFKHGQPLQRVQFVNTSYSICNTVFRSEDVCIFSAVDTSDTGALVYLFGSWRKSYKFLRTRKYKNYNCK